MTFNTIAEFLSLKGKDKPTSAEIALIKASRSGKFCSIANGNLPPDCDPADERRVRADLIRMLINEETQKCDQNYLGVWVAGAYITGSLNLRFAKARGRFTLNKCRFEEKPEFEQAHFAQINLDGSHMPGLFAQGVKVDGSIFLRGIKAKGEIDLNSAHIGVQVNCSGARMFVEEGTVLNAQGAVVGSDIVLSKAKTKGSVDISGANIGGQVVCSAAELVGIEGRALNAQGTKIEADFFLKQTRATGGINLHGATIGGQLNCIGGGFYGVKFPAFAAQNMVVREGFFFQKLYAISGQVDLTNAHVAVLDDDLNSWPLEKDMLRLDGFTYSRLSGTSPLSLKFRREWLKNGSHYKGRFSPQPYTQLALVFRTVGLDKNSHKVLFLRQKAIHQAERKDYISIVSDEKKRIKVIGKYAMLTIAIIYDYIIENIAGYGYVLKRSLLFGLIIIAISSLIFSYAYKNGAIVPNSDVIMNSYYWLTSMYYAPDAPTLMWDDSPPGRHYETFYSLAYSLDVFIPLVNLGQQSSWSATTISWLGWSSRLLSMILEIVGWIFTALWAAGLAGLMRNGTSSK